MKCSICGKEIVGYGNNPYPVRTSDDDRCCDECNNAFVIPARLFCMNKSTEAQEEIAYKLNECSYDKLCEIF